MPPDDTNNRERDADSDVDSKVLVTSSRSPMVESGRTKAALDNGARPTRSRWLLEEILLTGHAPAWVALAGENAVGRIALGRASEEDFR